MPTWSLSSLDNAVQSDPEYRAALESLARREAVARKLIRLRLEIWSMFSPSKL